jgi:adenosylhomocysteine nucleosidase
VDTPGTGSVVILTALDLEYEAVSRHLTELEPVGEEGTLFERGKLPGYGAVTLALIGESNLSAAALAERARAAFSPRALLMVGIAGALKNDIGLGDIVVATKVYAYHGGKEEGSERLNRPRAWEADHALLQLAHYVGRGEAWTRYLVPDPARPRPAVHFKPIAAGEVVLNSRDSPLAAHLHRDFNDAAAIETESAGIAQTGGLSRSLPVLTVRGISDHADGAKRAADQGGWQPAAAANAAAFALALTAQLHLTPSAVTPRSREVNQTVIAYGGNAFGVADGNMYHYGSPSDEPSGPAGALRSGRFTRRQCPRESPRIWPARDGRRREFPLPAARRW